MEEEAVAAAVEAAVAVEAEAVEAAERLLLGKTITVGQNKSPDIFNFANCLGLIDLFLLGFFPSLVI